MLNLNFIKTKQLPFKRFNKMKRFKIDIDKLVEITYKNFKIQKIDPKYYPLLSTCNNNVWRKIAEEYFGEFSYKEALLLYTRFKRNTEGYAAMVKAKFNRSHILFETDADSIELMFEKQEFEAFEISGKSRNRLLVDFEEALNKKLQENGFNCYFKCDFNWFKQKTDFKNFKIIDWSGLYICTEPKCSNFIRPKIFCEPSEFVILKVFYSTINEHSPIKKNARIRGAERKALSISLKSEGVSNFSSRINFENYLEEKTNMIRLSTLHKIKNELDNRFRLSRDLIFDLRATKVLCQNLGTSTNSDFMGYVHNICLDPYGFLLMSDIQVKIWDLIKIKNPVWYLDATGSVHKDVYMQKKPLLYSIVMHDKVNKQILPLAEFITTDQSIKSISNYLYNIEYNLQEKRKPKDFKIAPIIVTDFSWALINSVLIVFNKMTVQEYLDWCFQKILGKEEIKTNIFLPNTRLYLCSTHFLKLIVKKAKQICSDPIIKTLFIFCFTLLQNSLSIAQFKNYLLNISNIFNCKQKNTKLFYSLSIIRREIRNRNLDCFDHSTVEESESCIVDEEKQKLKSDIPLETIESLKKSSKFKTYFDLILLNFARKTEKFDSKPLGKNNFYNPKLFNLIVDQLYLLPLWTGLMIEDLKINLQHELFESFTTRLTNNPVENYFGVIKNRILAKKKVFPSEFVSLNFLRIKSKFFEFYSEKKALNEQKTKNIILNEKEKWSDKKKNKKEKKQYRYQIDPIKEKGFYYQNRDIYKLIYYDLFEFDPNVLNVPTQEFEKFSFFIDQFVNQTNHCEPMEVDYPDKKFLSFGDKKFNFDSILADFQVIYENIVKDENSIESIIDYMYCQKQKFIDLVKFIRSIKLSVIYSDQMIENYRPFNLIIDLFEINDFVPISTIGDGNCFYRSVSFCLFGSDDYFYLLKVGSLFILLEYRNLFEEIIQKHFHTKPFEATFFSSTRKNEWAMSLNILATSILLDRAIYSYGLNNETFVPFCQKYLIATSDSEPIRLGFFINHFIPLLHKSRHCFDAVNNAFDLYVNIRDNFKLINYE